MFEVIIKLEVYYLKCFNFQKEMYVIYCVVIKELEVFFFFWKIYVKDNFFGVNFEVCSWMNMYISEFYFQQMCSRQQFLRLKNFFRYMVNCCGIDIDSVI